MAAFGGSGFVSQATRNLYARLGDAVLAVHDGDPHKISEANARVSRIVEAAMPLNGSAKETQRRISYNATGKITTILAMPAYADYLDSQHDTEALRRMLALKISALQQLIPAQKMREFLAQRWDAFFAPYTGAPFGWDFATREIRFAPRSKQWKKDPFAVTYFPATASGSARAGGRK